MLIAIMPDKMYVLNRVVDLAKSSPKMRGDALLTRVTGGAEAAAMKTAVVEQIEHSVVRHGLLGGSTGIMINTLEGDLTIMMMMMLAVIVSMAVTAIKGEVLMQDYRGRKALQDLGAIKNAEGGHGVIMEGMR